MSFTMTISWCSSSSKMVSTTSLASSRRPPNTSAYMRATRPGVPASPSRSGSSPMASRMVRTAPAIASRSGGSACSLAIKDAPLGSGTRFPNCGHAFRNDGIGGCAVVAVGNLNAHSSALGVLPLGNIGEDCGYLGGIDGLAFHQDGSHAVEGVAMRRQDLPGFFMCLADELSHLGVDERRNLIRYLSSVGKACVCPRDRPRGMIVTLWMWSAMGRAHPTRA